MGGPNLTNHPPGQLLEGKVAVVTGANRGIGRAIAELFMAHGAHVLACVRDPGSCDLGGAVTPIHLDLADDEAIRAAIKEIRAAAPGVDVLVNNAGVASGALFQMTSIRELRSVFEVNFFGPVILTQQISRLMARGKAGSIVNISSTAAQIANPGTLAYGASKAAFARAAQSLATELGPLGIRVNVIAPGVTRTDMFDQMDPEAREKLISASALKREGAPADVANAALFLASDLSTHITGQIIRVDGGIV